MISPFGSAPSNCLLASLPPEVTELLRSRIMSVDLQAGEMLYEVGAVLRHVYFPVTAVVSLVSPLQDGARAEWRWSAEKALQAFAPSWAAARR